MQPIFNFIYEFLCGKNHSEDEYHTRIFGSVGLLTLLIAIMVCVLFYMLSRFFHVWYTRVHWFITVLLCAIIGFAIAYAIAKSIIGSSNGYMFQFAFANAFIIMVYFILLSLVLKRFSIHAKRTPF